MKLPLLICLLACCFPAHAQSNLSSISIVDSGRDCSIRGMSVAGNDVVWVSGSKGHVGRSTDGGTSWTWSVVAGYEKTDFRDIHAFDSLRAVIMGVDNPAYILKTGDGGRSWKLVFTKTAPGMFLDAMDFRNNGQGICIGDPMDAGHGRKSFFVIRSRDGGDTWQPEAPGRLPPTRDGEAIFSASGTNIALLDGRDFDYAVISGGLVSNLYLIGRKGKANAIHPLRIAAGNESSGAFSLATDRRRIFYCIGGDYKQPDARSGTFVWTTDQAKSWKTSVSAAPSGYRSCIRIIDGERMVACGTNGVDLCLEPAAWTHVSTESFNVCAVSPDKKRIFFGGGKGRIGMLRL